MTSEQARFPALCCLLMAALLAPTLAYAQSCETTTASCYWDDCLAQEVCDYYSAPAAAGTVCRPASGACDVAETCDGVNLNCPPDLSMTPEACAAASGSCVMFDLLWPSNGISGLDPAVVLDWSDVPNAVRYRVKVIANGACAEPDGDGEHVRSAGRSALVRDVLLLVR